MLTGGSTALETAGLAPALFPVAEKQNPDSHPSLGSRALPSDAECDAMILAHLQDVRKIARTIIRRLPSSVQFDDLVQAGILGLIDAVRRFDCSRPMLFSQYARIRITGAIYDSLRDMDWASRYMRTRQQKLESTSAQLEKALGRQPSSDEIADAMGMDLDTFYEFACAVQDVQRVELDAQHVDEQHPVRDQLPADPAGAPDAILLTKEMSEYLRDLVSDLPGDEREVMSLYYFREWRMESIARHIHRTESRVSQIHSRAIARLRQRVRFGLRRPPQQRLCGHVRGEPQ